jgi:transcriptional antiterminator RfaH
MAWHVIISSPQQEIRASIEVSKAGFEVFFPIKRYVRRPLNRPEQIVTGPLFPRYFFASFERENPEWAKILDMRGVSDVLRNGNKPVIVRDAVIDAIREYREPEKAPEGQTVFEKGQRVRVSTGVLTGIEGLFQGSDRQRTKAFLEILGKKIELPYETIDAA